MNVLKFENPDEALSWCETHGLRVELDKDVVLLSRSSFIDLPEKFPPIRRSFRLIEGKRNGPLSLIIANRPINTEALASHRPQNSFDPNGFLKKEALFDDEHARQTKECLNVQDGTSSKPKSQSSQKFSSIDSLSMLVFEDLVRSETQEITINAIREQTRRGKLVRFITQKLWDVCLRQVKFQYVFLSTFRMTLVFI